jgi:DNA-binding transcriptional LysR family regulator
MIRTVDWESRIGRRLRLRDLHVFFAVVKSGSMAGAAAQLRIKQPSVSKAIGDLEATLGVQLFDRSPRGVAPTMYGNELIKCGAVVFDELKQGIRSIEALADPTQGELRIACLAGVSATDILPAVIQRFRQDHSRVLLHVDDVPSLPSLLSGLRDRGYDVAMTRTVRPLTADEDDLNAEVLFNDRMVIVAGAHNRLAHRRRVDLAELVDEPWILSEPVPENSRLAEAFETRGLPMPKASLLTLSLPLRAHLLANGPYITPFAEATLRLFTADRHAITALPVELPHRPWPVVAMTLKNRTLVPVAERFIAYAREAAKPRSPDRPKPTTPP